MFISAYLIRNYLNNDPLLDWLELYGEKKGFKKDDIQSIFLQFLSQKKHQFKQKNIDSILNRVNSLNLNCFEIDVTLSVRRRIAKTIDQMYLGTDIIFRGGVYHQTTTRENWYMVPDILIKKSQIRHVFP